MHGAPMSCFGIEIRRQFSTYAPNSIESLKDTVGVSH